MKQLSLFPPQKGSGPEEQESSTTHWKLFVDGASRNNPGKAGAGIYILKDGQMMLEHGSFIGTKTNNQAEYAALLLGLFFLRSMVNSGDQVRVISDSLLVVNQMVGAYKVRDEKIKPLHALAQRMASDIGAQITHVLRIENGEADRMANVGIDKQIPLPDVFIQFLHDHGISL